MAQITAEIIAQELSIPCSYLFFLRATVALNMSSAWDTSFVNIVKEHMDLTNISTGDGIVYKTTRINNRRYLGNKYKLLPFITRIVNENCCGIETVADIFSGTGAVASAFTERTLITNDNMYSNYICHVAWFGSQHFSMEKIINYVIAYNSLEISENNYMTENFADTYFSRSDCSKIGYIRQDIENEFSAGRINERERAILITSLLYAMDKIANTCGHYDAYRQGAKFEKKLELSVPLAENNNNPTNQCFNMDANELVKRIHADLVYIDPPYNSRQYCDAYHLIENVARWEKPAVSGVAKKMDRSALKSDYCTKKAAEAFERLVEEIDAKYILLSYNNMAEKGNGRSNAKISDDDIMRILGKKGTVKVFEESYKAFTTGKSDIKDNKERLFLCICDKGNSVYDKLIPSPINYTGGKFKLLGQMIPLFPKSIRNFIDLFSGGCNVGINIKCNQVIFNDNNQPLQYMFSAFRNLEKDELLKLVRQVIDKYGLSLSSEKGYKTYNCESSKGLSNFNKEKFIHLRDDFNNSTNKDYYYYVMLYVLIVYSFNNQIRFNRDGQFNLPVGKRDFNSKMNSKLCDFVDRLQSGNFTFKSCSFDEIYLDSFNSQDFIYADPPYLITCASYNEQNGWNEELEKELYRYLDEASNRGIRFALSNVLSSKGKVNEILQKWLDDNKRRYKVIHLDYSYSNSNYHKINRTAESDEILVINY
jgi:adenine-specific DNA-methyltransferase